MITFYPGPSKIDERLPQWLQEGLENGMLSMNHRSEAFMQQYHEIVDLFREVFYLPENYDVYFTSSATECWEIIAQSFQGKSFRHIYNGAFGEKWLKMNAALGNTCREDHFGISEYPPVPDMLEEDLLCLTHNETSNGTRLPDKYLIKLRDQYREKIIAIDATSSMAGVMLPWLAADIWYASVQKCFGLPAGMAVMFVHKNVLDKICIGPYYNHMANLHRHFDNLQTTHTPNVANIYFLWRLLQDHKGLEVRSEKLIKRANYLYDFFENKTSYSPLVKDRNLRSDTVLCLKGIETEIPNLLSFMESKDMVLGKGYGPWKNETFRIANFPAIKRNEYNALQKNFKKWMNLNKKQPDHS